MAGMVYDQATTGRGIQIASAVLFDQDPEYDEVAFETHFLQTWQIHAFLWLRNSGKAIRALFQVMNHWVIHREGFSFLMASSEECSKLFIRGLGPICTLEKTHDAFGADAFVATLLASIRTSTSLPIHLVASLSKGWSNSEIEIAKQRFIRWMLPPGGPRSSLTMADLEAVSYAYERSTTMYYSHDRDILQVDTAIILALRFSSPSSTRFLLRRAEVNPSALVALALRDPVRYRGVIWKIAMQYLGRPGAVLALRLTGDLRSRAKEVSRRATNLPDFSEMAEVAGRVIESCQSFDVASLTSDEVLMNVEKEHVRLILMHYLWNEFESSLNQKRFPSFVGPLRDQPGVLEELGLDSGLSLWLSFLYANARSDEREVLAGAIGALRLSTRHLLVADALCGHSLFAEPALLERVKVIDLTDHPFPELLHLSFVDPSGEFYPVASVPQSFEEQLRGSFDGYVPPVRLVKWMRVLASKGLSIWAVQEPHYKLSRGLWEIVKANVTG